MDVVGAVAAGVVGLAFMAAGVLKLADGRAWPRQAADLRVARPLALIVPWVEIVIGALLTAQLLEPWTAWAAIVMLVAFTIVIGLRLRESGRPPCNCFGSRSTRPLGSYHLLRNLGLLVVAVLAAIWT